MSDAKDFLAHIMGASKRPKEVARIALNLLQKEDMDRQIERREQHEKEVRKLKAAYQKEHNAWMEAWHVPFLKQMGIPDYTEALEAGYSFALELEDQDEDKDNRIMVITRDRDAIERDEQREAQQQAAKPARFKIVDN